MALSQKDSIAASVKKFEFVRNTTRDFYINCSRLFHEPRGEGSNSAASNEGMNRYYQIKVNSLLNLDHDDIDFLVKSGERNFRCIRCGNNKKLQLKSRRKQNKSVDRKHCRYLRSICTVNCDKCGQTSKFKSQSRRAILDKLSERKLDQDKPKLLLKPTKQISEPSKAGPKPKGPAPSMRLLCPPKVSQLQPSKIKKNQSKLGSNFRAFSCLLKE